MTTEIDMAEIGHDIAELGEHVDALVGKYRERAAEKGHEQALSDLVGLCLATPVLAQNCPGLLMVAIGRLSEALSTVTKLQTKAAQPTGCDMASVMALAATVLRLRPGTPDLVFAAVAMDADGPAVMLQLAATGDDRLSGIARWAAAFGTTIRLTRARDNVRAATSMLAPLESGELVPVEVWTYIEPGDLLRMSWRLGVIAVVAKGGWLEFSPQELLGDAR